MPQMRKISDDGILFPFKKVKIIVSALNVTVEECTSG